MRFPTNPEISQLQSLQNRVEAKVSDQTGNLEDQSLDVDARTMAVLGKRQQLSVRRVDCRSSVQGILIPTFYREILVSSHWSPFRQH